MKPSRRPVLDNPAKQSGAVTGCLTHCVRVPGIPLHWQEDAYAQRYTEAIGAELTGKVGGGITLREGAEVLGAVGAVELHGGAGHLPGALQGSGVECGVRAGRGDGAGRRHDAALARDAKHDPYPKRKS